MATSITFHHQEKPHPLQNSFPSQVPKCGFVHPVICIMLKVAHSLIENHNQMNLNTLLLLSFSTLCHVFYANAGFMSQGNAPTAPSRAVSVEKYEV